MQTQINTERLLLNTITENDHAFVLAILNTKGWLEFIGDRNVHSRQDAIEYIERIRNMQDLTYWVVQLKDGNTPIGIVSFIKRAYLEHFDIGFAFLPEFNGQGYAFEAAEKVLSIATTEAGYSPVLATTVPQNTSSIKLLTKLGLHFEKEIEVENEPLHVYST